MWIGREETLKDEGYYGEGILMAKEKLVEEKIRGLRGNLRKKKSVDKTQLT